MVSTQGGPSGPEGASRARRAAVAAALALVAGGCADGSDERTTVIRTTAIFSPSTGDVPLPNDLLFAGSTDGTLAVPLPSDPAEQGPALALGSLDGWSTTAPLRVRFSRPLEPSTVVAGTSVRLFEVALAPAPGLVRGAPVASVVRELAPSEFAVRVAPEDAAAVEVAPLVPLEPATSYMVALTDDLVGTDGFQVMRSIVYELAAQPAPLPASDPLRPLQVQVSGMLDAAEAAGLDRSDVVLSFAFTTQSIGGVVDALSQIARGDGQALIDALCLARPELVCDDPTPDPRWTASLVMDPASPGSTGSLIGSPLDAADVYLGELTLPYFLEDAADAGTPSGLSSDTTPLETFFRARYELGAGDPDRHVNGTNPIPQVREEEVVPVLLTVPKGAVPPGGWPVVVYQHAVTADRSTLFGLADTLAINGFAAVAIDLPLHGVADGGLFAFLFAGHQDGQVRERHFGLDLVDNASGAPGPDGQLDPSGQHFINLSSLRSSRDNVRQAVADLFALTSTLDKLDYDGTPGADLDASRLYFVGHSLGAIVGSLYLTRSPEVVAAVLGMPGGGLAKVLSESPSFGPEIEAGLAAAGILPDTAEYEDFLFAAQTVLDDADPLSYAATLAQTDKPLLLFEVVGDPNALPPNLPDQTIPNTVAGAPLSGTEPLVAALGLVSISANTVDPSGLRGVVRFTDGDHTSLIVPLTSAAATFEMQAMASEFFGSDGQMVSVINGFVVQ